MLVIGVLADRTIISFDLEVDLDDDSPRKIHDSLKQETNSTKGFVQIICVEDDEVVATYTDEDDYDLTEETIDDREDDDKDEINFDELGNIID